ncbi:MAG: hypothetical protein ACTHKF_02725, partial [Candidatus Nitrosocosmicus sp.]
MIIFLFVVTSAQSSGHYSDAITDNHNLQLLKENELQHQLNISQLHISSSAGNLSSTFQMPNIIQTLPSKSPLPLSSKVNGNINSTISDSSTNANKVIILTFGDGY